MDLNKQLTFEIQKKNEHIRSLENDLFCEKEKVQNYSKKTVELQEELLGLKDKISLYQARAYGFDVAKKFEIYNKNHYKNTNIQDKSTI